jgi:hypothetical protein
MLPVMILNRSLEPSIAFITAQVPSLGAYRDQSQPGTCHQRSNKKRFRYFPLSFAAQMGPERRPVGSLSGENELRRLIALLLGGCRHDSGDECRVDLESLGEVRCNLRRNRASGQQLGERPVAVADPTVTEAADKLGPTQSERSGASKMSRPTEYISSSKRA